MTCYSNPQLFFFRHQTWNIQQKNYFSNAGKLVHTALGQANSVIQGYSGVKRTIQPPAMIQHQEYQRDVTNVRFDLKSLKMKKERSDLGDINQSDDPHRRTKVPFLADARI